MLVQTDHGEHRVVYKVSDARINFLQARYHY